MHEWLARDLLRHAARRRGGLTTVSLLVGEPEHMRQVLAEQVVTLVQTSARDSRAMASDYLHAVGSEDALRERALEQVARALGTTHEALRGGWVARSTHERALWLEQLEASTHAAPVHAALRWLARGNEPQATVDEVSTLHLLCCWYPSDLLPTLCVQLADGATIESAASLSCAIPQLPIAVPLSPAHLGECMKALKPRLRAMLHEGIIYDREAGEPHTLELDLSRTDEESAKTQTDQTWRELPRVEPDDPPAVIAMRSAAATALEAAQASAHEGEETDAARSLVERLLFEVLQQSPITRDVFELNGVLPFSFGGRRTEVDFISRALKLALEIDGYHHFTDADAYRRDRRKDLLLQQRGFLVARYLAEDVLHRTSEVRQYIEALVEAQRGAVELQEE